MSVRNQFKLLVGGLAARRAGAAAPAARSAMREFLDRSRLVAAVIFFLTVAAIVVVSSAGVSTLHAPVNVDQVATRRITALAPFRFESAEKTRVAREQFLDGLPPVYRLDAEPLRRIEAATKTLLAQLAAHEAAGANGPPAPVGHRAELARIADTFNSHGPTYNATPEDVAAVLAAGDARQRAELFDSGLATLRDIYAQGVGDAALAGLRPSGSLLFQIVRPDGQVAQRPVQTMEEALTALRVSLSVGGVPRAASQTAFRLFRFGLVPNVAFDRGATSAHHAAAAEAIKPVVVSVPRGQVIVDAGSRVTREQHEMLIAHRQHLLDHGDADVSEGLTLFGRVLLVLAMVLASLIYIRIEDPETLRSNVRLGLLALVVIANLALVRANYSLGGAEFFLRDGAWASTLPYVAPTAFAPLIVAILINAGSGIFMALLISIFTGVIYGNRLDLLVLTFLASLVAIYCARDARRRALVVRAAGAGGLTVAAFAALIGIADQTPIGTLWRQMAAGLGTGLLTGIGVVGLLPVLESLFKRTTDITLLELTDYNHPLLRRMQLEAPGTYHHSLVVAQLSENAANAIGANPLVARACALFHDIGKIPAPHFFGENARNGADAHAALSPAESARVIRQHVPDGLDLARKHRLPRAVLDVIQQHHGTTLVRYFYLRAVEQSRGAAARTARPEGGGRQEAGDRKKHGNPAPATDFPPPASPLPSPAAALDAAAFRYDGPKPQTRESAIISLADGVEATTRSLRKVDADNLHEVINRTFADRIADGQLDDAPLTLEQLTRVKHSFHFTLLNMLHARVAYPAPEPGEPDIAAKA